MATPDQSPQIADLVAMMHDRIVGAEVTDVGEITHERGDLVAGERRGSNANMPVAKYF